MEQRAAFQRMFAWLRRHTWQFVALFAGILLPLYLFGELAEDVWNGEALTWDDATLLYLHSMRAPLLDTLMVWLSWLGYEGVAAVDIGVLLALIVRRRWRPAFFWGLAVGGAGLLNVAAKHTFARVRPSLWSSIAPETTFSFPSGHAMGSMALAAALCVLVWDRRWRWFAVVVAMVWVVLVCVSRLYLGVHYPSDVIAGCLASFAWVMGLAMTFFGRGSRAPADPPQTTAPRRIGHRLS